MDFKLAVIGSVPDGLDPAATERLKDAMADVIHQSLSALSGVEPKAFYLQVGEGMKVNVRTVPAESDCDCVDHSDGCRAGMRD